MQSVNTSETLTLAEALDLIISVPHNRFMLEGEPGIGKSSLMSAARDRLPNHAFGYIDAGTMDLGDAALPAADLEAKCIRYLPNARFQMHKDNTPVLLMLDEFTKAPEPVKNMLHPLLEAHNPRLGDKPLPDGSIVFLTGNTSSDGVGDSMKGHTRNRISVVPVGKPTPEQWIVWGSENGIDPVLLAFVDQHPQVMQSYRDDPDGANPMIYNPKHMQRACCTPRSLAAASNIIRARDEISTTALRIGLAGTIGAPAAEQLDAFIATRDELPAFIEILEQPERARLPENNAAKIVLIYSLLERVSDEHFEPIVKYVKRLDAEQQSVFFCSLARDPRHQKVMMSSKHTRDWMLANQDIL